MKRNSRREIVRTGSRDTTEGSQRVILLKLGKGKGTETSKIFDEVFIKEYTSNIVTKLYPY